MNLGFSPCAPALVHHRLPEGARLTRGCPRSLAFGDRGKHSRQPNSKKGRQGSPKTSERPEKPKSPSHAIRELNATP
jgi:hypothetical protein